MARRRSRRGDRVASDRGRAVKIVSGKRMCRILEQRGWALARIHGSHHIYRDSTGRRIVVVPVHANYDLKPGTREASCALPD
jgi:predicted RNA binding protein YcfA (HicA-like mRNA interferase family)